METIKIGDRFDNLTVIGFSKKNPYSVIECKCDCGRVKSVRRVKLFKRRNKSCGCEKSVKQVCDKCGQNREKCGNRMVCKKCMVAYKAEWQRQNKDKVKKNNQKYLEKQKG